MCFQSEPFSLLVLAPRAWSVGEDRDEGLRLGEPKRPKDELIKHLFNGFHLRTPRTHNGEARG